MVGEHEPQIRITLTDDPTIRLEDIRVTGDELSAVAELMGGMQWLKEDSLIREPLDRSLSFLQEQLWMSKSNDIDRTPAKIIFLPGQSFLSCSEQFQQLQTFAPHYHSFDESEGVVQGITAANVFASEDKAKVKTVYVVGRIQDADDLMMLLQIAQGLREVGVEDITFLSPYMAWTRQDRRDDGKGETATLKLLINIILEFFNRAVITDIHSIEAARLAFSKEFPFCSISAWKYLLEHLKRGYSQENSCFVGPDIGRESHSARAAQYLGIDLVSLAKGRDGDKVDFQPLTEEQIVKIKGKRIIIFDDIIATASTLDKIRVLIGDYVESITVIATHASYIKDAIKILSHPKFERIIVTDSRIMQNIPPLGGKFEIVSCAELLKAFLLEDMKGNFNPWQHPDFKDIVSRC
jgi:ribose-phosphate pyrophosphokinase